MLAADTIRERQRNDFQDAMQDVEEEVLNEVRCEVENWGGVLKALTTVTLSNTPPAGTRPRGWLAEPGAEEAQVPLERHARTAPAVGQARLSDGHDARQTVLPVR